ncbi:hypothetical protein CHS0354_031686 [Potamilus streckersoni]|uniref:Cation/H+ exchanger transmembrane domain-containing protein n=1 Tax=Potamilus streckersoni TaxID=2493646 RepID=A0AAE0SRV7_9BIVA|nr:hypothetical protein CHS0354_031686 [Potamilus streckersoni]
MLMYFGFLMTVMTVVMTDNPSVPLTPSDAVAEAKSEEKVTKTHQTDSLTILMLLALLLLTVLTIWLFKHRRFRYVHETGLSMIYGLIVGAIIRYSNSPAKEITAEATLKNFNLSENPETIYITRFNQTLKYDLVGFVKKVAVEEVPLEKTVTFDSEIFFNIMLPIIIFEAGYSMKRRHFFRNIGAIMTYAFLGTTISFLVVGGIMYGLTRVNANVREHFHLNDCFFFGAIISATDPVTVLAIFHDLNVDVDLYALVFGEAVLNDAVSIVLSGSVEEYSKKAANGEGFSAEAFFMAVLNFLGFFFGSFSIGVTRSCQGHKIYSNAFSGS